MLSGIRTAVAKYSTINQKLGDSKRTTGGKTGGGIREIQDSIENPLGF
jgi:hypothetical protein